jgi:hypothetical protein
LAPRVPIQAKHQLGAVNDPLEHEADRVADQVMRMPDPEVSVGTAPPQVSRKCAVCDEHEKVQKEPAGPQAAACAAPAIVHEVLRSPGRPLDEVTRTYFEPRFGYDFSGVRVHTGASAEQSARDVNAHAYTVGHNMVFDAGRFEPATHEGRRLIAHELTHVVQQSGALTGPGLVGGRAASATLARQAVPETAPEEDPESDAEVQEEQREGNVVFTKPPANQNSPIREAVPGEDWRPDPSAELPTSPYHEQGSHTDWKGAGRYRGLQKKAAGLRYQLESRPKASLERGGTPPDFVTISKPQNYLVTRDDEQVWPELANSSVEYDPRYFHILDAIDHDVGLATTPDEDIGLLLSYFPDPKFAISPQLPEVYKGSKGTIYHPKLPRGAAVGRFFFDPDDQVTFDARSKAFAAALVKRGESRRQRLAADALAEAENVALKGRRRREGPCSYRPTPQKGGNPEHNQFARHVAAEKGYGRVSRELIWTTPEGVSYSFDTYNPKNKTEVWEVKTQHEWTSPTGMATAPYSVRSFSERITELEVQRLTGLYIANRCNLQFRYAVDNCPAYNGLRQTWALPPVEYIPYPGERKENCQ